MTHNPQDTSMPAFQLGKLARNDGQAKRDWSKGLTIQLWRLVEHKAVLITFPVCNTHIRELQQHLLHIHA